MKNWIQKTLVITVALLTFGVISPDHSIWESLLDEKANQNSTQNTSNAYAVDWSYEEPSTFIEDAIAHAKEQSILKFGTKIGPVISNEFEEVIFPKIQEAIEMTLVEMDQDTLKSLAISENPSGDHSEKIFHIFDTETQSDIIRFHVRTDRKPQDGYFFNFHYHTVSDQYVKHYSLGDIYWSKNMPPKWLS
ncbi:YpjP family protein [Paenisporosarcina indica]|uniref:YpjP family protein n=1 Tax=Paenisporosarcina indica TaxID=650093 RepID=UPI00094F91A9|nr:YpjP family protein [Paenisporosarcina indica]